MSSPASSTSTSVLDGFISGAVAGGTTRIVAAPFDMLKIRLQLEQKAVNEGVRYYSHVMHVATKIYREEGMRSFWRGNIAATCLWVSYSGVQFGCYQALQGLAGNKDYNVTWVSHSTSGAISGVVATVCTYPFDLCRTVLAGQGVPKVYPNMRSFVQYEEPITNTNCHLLIILGQPIRYMAFVAFTKDWDQRYFKLRHTWD
jgi:solute carrier family 25 thiamine pyrophosphate transporter 19